MGSLDAWYEHFEAGMLLKLVRREVRAEGMGKSEGQAVEEMIAKAKTRDSTRVFAKRAEAVEGELRITADPPTIIPLEDIVPQGSEWENPAPLINKLLAELSATAGHARAPAPSTGGVPLRTRGLQDGGRWQRRCRCYILLADRP